jgi:hypothetical protein
MIGPEAAGLSQGGSMDHDYIEQNHIADRYVLGTLPADESDRFEEHYLSCQECLGRLERAESLQRGLKRAAAEDAARVALARRAGFLAVLARLGRSRLAGLAAAALLVILILPSWLAFRQAGRLGEELERANAALAAREPEVQRPTGEDLEAARRQLAEERGRFQDELEKERGARAGLERDLAQALQPQTNTPILTLSPERSGPSSAEPTHQLRLPATPGWVVLSLELDRAEHETYRATLLREGRQEVWRGGGLRPNDLDSLVVTLHSTRLAPGDYVLRVEGTPPGGGAVPVAQFPFRVRPAYS